MKKVSTIIMALAVILGMTQCTKPAMQLYDGTYTGVTKEITFSTGGSSKVTVDNSVLNELKFKWEEEDQLYVYGSASDPFSDGKYCGSLALVKGEGTENGFFSGTLDNVPTSGKLRFYYCPKELFDKEEKTITVDLSSQDGSLEDVASHLVACADVTVKPDGGDYSATLAVPYSIVKLDLHEFGTTDITMTGTTNKGLTVTANGVKDVMTGGSTTLSGTAVATNTCYVSIMPESVTTLNFSGNSLVGSKSVTLSENKFETLNGGGGGVPVPAAEPVEGDDWINFNDPAMGVTGLPIWSKKNLGATCSTANPTDSKTATTWYGDYYAWGEVAPYYNGITWTSATSGSVDGWKTDKTAGYYWESYKWCNGNWNTLTKYNTDSYYGTVDNKKTLDDVDDAAYQSATPANTWRMPTGGASGEWQQLASNTYFQWVYGYKGIAGLNGFVVYKVKDAADKGLMTVDLNYDPNDPSWRTYNQDWDPATVHCDYTVSDPHMFLPAAGTFYGTSLSSAGSCGCYWSSSLYSGGPSSAWGMYFLSGDVDPQYDDCRYYGLAVRPVQ